MTPTPRCYCCGHNITAPAVHIYEPERLVPKALCIPCLAHIDWDAFGCLLLPDPYPHGLRLVRDDE